MGWSLNRDDFTGVQKRASAFRQDPLDLPQRRVLISNDHVEKNLPSRESRARRKGRTSGSPHREPRRARRELAAEEAVAAGIVEKAALEKSVKGGGRIAFTLGGVILLEGKCFLV